jgi:hypothetical protein
VGQLDSAAEDLFWARAFHEQLHQFETDARQIGGQQQRQAPTDHEADTPEPCSAQAKRHEADHQVVASMRIEGLVEHFGPVTEAVDGGEGGAVERLEGGQERRDRKRAYLRSEERAAARIGEDGPRCGFTSGRVCGGASSARSGRSLEVGELR